LNPQEEKVLEFTREIINKKSKFLLISIILKKIIYKLGGLFKSSMKLDRQENIFKISSN